MVWAYIENGADDSVTLRDNRKAFDRWALRPSVLTSAQQRNVSKTVCGSDLSLPLLAAPTGLNGLAHWRGDMDAAAGAVSAGTRLVLSTAASYSIEEVAGGEADDHWFQLYPWRNRELTGQLLERGKAAGYRVLVVTVDVPVVGNREDERLRGMGIPPVLTPDRVLDASLHPRWAYGFIRHQRVSMRNLVETGGIAAGTASAEVQRRQMNLSPMRWDDFAWIREQWPGPLLIKGVLEADDAGRAVELGADGVVVSNHGGRQLDFAQATLDALPTIAERVGSRATVLLDGGIRRGSDVVKALCLGAHACLVGRPILYGLAADGKDGVAHVLEILREEIDRTMTLTGVASLVDLDRSLLLARPTS